MFLLHEPISEELRELLAEYDDLTASLLARRGIRSREEAHAFLSPSYEEHIHDPMRILGMEKAAARIAKAIETKERITVWSDYDCDGIPGGVMLTEFLRTLGLKTMHYIPHRHREGFGLNKAGLTSLADEGVALVITIDLGTSEHENILFAKEKGMDVIVTDHHEPMATLPPALAVINPKRHDSRYPFAGLCGAGVAWKLVQALLIKLQPGAYALGQEKWLLDLVGLATLSDMVPLVGENRMLAHFGLLVMRRARRPGLAALLKLLRIEAKHLTEDDVGFMLSPRINAASRMDKPETAAALLGATSLERAAEFARELNRVNDERKGLVASIAKEANKRLKESGAESPVIVLGNPNWRPGVLGLVANTLAEAHGKPVFLWGREGGEVLRGSVRSPTVSVVALMQEAGDIFTEFGGHHASGGFSLEEGAVHTLMPRLAQAYKTLEPAHGHRAEAVVDRELSFAEAPSALRDLAKLAPFGVGNEKPLFIFRNVQAVRVRSFGKGRDHLEVAFAQAGGGTLAGMAFFATPESFTKKLEQGVRADIVGHLERDWRGHPRVRIVEVL